MKTMTVLLTGLLLLASGPAAAQCAIPVDNADPGTGGGNPLPFNSSYTPELGFQEIAPSRFLPRNPCRIQDIEYAPANSGTFSSNDFLVRLAHSTLDFPLCSLWSNPSGPLTTVRSGSIGINFTANTWTPVGLTATWTYDGVQGVLVDIRRMSSTGDINLRMADLRPMNAYFLGAGGYNATACSHGIGIGGKFRLVFADPTIRYSGTQTPGTALPITICSPGQAGMAYVMGAALTTQPGIPLPNGATLPLTLDGLLLASLVLPTVFVNFQGALDSNAAAAATLLIPPNPGLTGLRFHLAFLTLDPAAPGQIGSVSTAAPVQIR